MKSTTTNAKIGERECVVPRGFETSSDGKKLQLIARYSECTYGIANETNTLRAYDEGQVSIATPSEYLLPSLRRRTIFVSGKKTDWRLSRGGDYKNRMKCKNCGAYFSGALTREYHKKIFCSSQCGYSYRGKSRKCTHKKKEKTPYVLSSGTVSRGVFRRHKGFVEYES